MMMAPKNMLCQKQLPGKFCIQYFSSSNGDDQTQTTPFDSCTCSKYADALRLDDRKRTCILSKMTRGNNVMLIFKKVVGKEKSRGGQTSPSS